MLTISSCFRPWRRHLYRHLEFLFALIVFWSSKNSQTAIAFNSKKNKKRRKCRKAAVLMEPAKMNILACRLQIAQKINLWGISSSFTFFKKSSKIKLFLFWNVLHFILNHFIKRNQKVNDGEFPLHYLRFGILHTKCKAVFGIIWAS